MSRPFRPVEHYAAGGAAMVDAIERLERELAAVRADLAAILYLVPGLSPAEIARIRRAPTGTWAAAIANRCTCRLFGTASTQTQVGDMDCPHHGDRLGSDDG